MRLSFEVRESPREKRLVSYTNAHRKLLCAHHKTTFWCVLGNQVQIDYDNGNDEYYVMILVITLMIMVMKITKDQTSTMAF